MFLYISSCAFVPWVVPFCSYSHFVSFTLWQSKGEEVLLFYRDLLAPFIYCYIDYIEFWDYFYSQNRKSKHGFLEQRLNVILEKGTYICTLSFKHCFVNIKTLFKYKELKYFA